MIDFSKFRSSLLRLEEQYEHHLTLSAADPHLVREGIAESVIQRFETCYDCLWKVLKRYLREELGVADLPNSPKPIFRIANESRLLPSHIERWLLYADARTDIPRTTTMGTRPSCV